MVPVLLLHVGTPNEARPTDMNRIVVLSISLLSFAGLACDSQAVSRGVEPGTEAPDGRTRGGKADKNLSGSCEDSCGAQSMTGSCWCDAKCAELGDCCEDAAPVCEDTGDSCPNLVQPPEDFCPPGEQFSWGADDNGCMTPSCDPIPAQSCQWDAPCGEGEYCHYEQAQACGQTQDLGECRVIPDSCSKHFDPVCGCDGEVYSNECHANAAGHSATPAAQGSDGFVCPDLFAKCDAEHPCDDGQFCNWAPNEACGDGTGSGVCIPQPEGCTEQFAPVCGCDGEVYGNACSANAAGLSWVPAAQSSDGFICPSLQDPGPAPAPSCEGECGGAGSDGSCWCDDKCASLGDCCDDKADHCG